jgi:hypothetical protein
MRITSTGYLGIGTTNPLAPLHVTASAGGANDRTLIIQDKTSGNGGEAWLSFKAQLSEDDERIKGAIVYANKGSDWGVGNLLFCLNDTEDNSHATTSSHERMRITSAGNVGVGSSSPLSRLETTGSGAGTLGLVSHAALRIKPAQTGSTDQIVFGYAESGTHASGVIGYVATSTTDYQKGNLIFATRDVVTNTAPTVRARILADGSFHLEKSTNETEATAQLLINGGGYAGFHWLDSTAYYIGQNSSIRSLRIYSSDETAGVNLAAGGTSWGTFSDERLKYDIEPITDGLNKLSGIRCVSYRLKDVDASDSQKKLGVIAQDLVGVVDEVIDITKRHGDETDYMSVRYTELIPVLIKAMQEQQAIIESLKARLDAANL